MRVCAGGINKADDARVQDECFSAPSEVHESLPVSGLSRDTPDKDTLAEERANIAGQMRALELQIESASQEISDLQESLK